MTRHHTITEKIPGERTGLKAALFVHVDFTDAGRPDAVRFAEKGKDGSTLDTILTALGDTVTDILRSAA